MDKVEKINNIFILLNQLRISGQENIFCLGNAMGLLQELLDYIRIEEADKHNIKS